MDTMDRIARDNDMEELTQGEMRTIDGGIIAVLIGLCVPISRGENLLLPAIQA